MSSQESTTRNLWPPLRYEVPAWTHFLWLIYLGFLFTPLLSGQNDWTWLWPTLLSLPVFLALYVSVIFKFRRSNPPGAAALPEILAMAAMGFLLAPVNESANTYIIYCVALASLVVRGFRRLILFVMVLLSAYALELAWLGFRPLTFGITTVVALASGTSNYMMLQNRLRNLALQRSGEEVHRLARLAERERISRDLHDLLGHTLSLIAIKSELAAKLMERDRAAAEREVTEVMNIARDALRQVRTAVTGIRSAALEGEVVSARAMLDTAGVILKYERDGTVLPPEVETTLAMIVREAVTNIQRHSRAGAATIQVLLDEGAADKAVLLQVSDDGRGGITAPGNGLAGIRERVEALGGTLEIESPRGEGTLLRVRVPLVVAGVPEGGVGVLGGDAAESARRAFGERARAEVPVAGVGVWAGDAAESVKSAFGERARAEAPAAGVEVLGGDAAVGSFASEAGKAKPGRLTETSGAGVAVGSAEALRRPGSVESAAKSDSGVQVMTGSTAGTGRAVTAEASGARTPVVKHERGLGEASPDEGEATDGVRT